MDNSMKTGFMAVFAVSGSVVFLAMQAHKRLLSNFMKKMEFETGISTGIVKDERKKKVRFADDVVYLTAEEAFGGNQLRRVHSRISANNNEYMEDNDMPQNWKVMYKSILQCRNLNRGYY